MEKFEELGLSGDMLKGIVDLGFETPSPVQEKVIPVILGETNDIVVLAQTGTGKTAAFGLPLLQKLDSSSNKIQVLILSPTRELCVQIGSDLANYSKYRRDIRILSVYGGTDIRRQIKELHQGVHILVATPGRLCDLLKRKAVNIEAVRYVVLDEADEMLNMGFKEDLNFILDETPKERNTYLFSATMPREVERIARHYLRNAQEISVGKKNQGADTVSHHYYQVRAKDCYETLRRVIDCAPDMYAIIFTRTKNDARDIANHLHKDGIDCDALHGDLSQSQRDDVMGRFRSKRLKVLVATDVAARGLDVDNLTHVINYNLPDDVESYTHRSGRTGRAGREGISVAIVHSKESGKVRRIENMLKKKFEYKPVPGGADVCRAQLLYYADKVVASEHKDTLTPYQDELFNKFAQLTKEELLQKIVSHEFGRVLKKYADVADLNLSDTERHSPSREGRGIDRDRGVSGRYGKYGREGRGTDRGRGAGRDSGGSRDGGKRFDRGTIDKRGGDRGNIDKKGDSNYTLFNMDLGKIAGLTPKDVMGLINQYAPRRGMAIGGIRIYDDNTKFEVDISNNAGFSSHFREATFRGAPLKVTQLEGGKASSGGSLPFWKAHNEWEGKRSSRRTSGSNNKWKRRKKM
ncbi:DEAD/DEAH box helicase [Bacteroidia bacterium]|nr:DEAD/DEAH box helicase [Bacteroidia bacterium]